MVAEYIANIPYFLQITTSLGFVFRICGTQKKMVFILYIIETTMVNERQGSIARTEMASKSNMYIQ